MHVFEPPCPIDNRLKSPARSRAESRTNCRIAKTDIHRILARSLFSVLKSAFNWLTALVDSGILKYSFLKPLRLIRYTKVHTEIRRLCRLSSHVFGVWNFQSGTLRKRRAKTITFVLGSDIHLVNENISNDKFGKIVIFKLKTYYHRFCFFLNARPTHKSSGKRETV